MEKGELSGRLRKKMVQVLVSHLMKVYGERPSGYIKLQLAKQIVTEFPLLKTSIGEGYESFYTPGSSKHPATGFLEIRLRNVRRTLSKGRGEVAAPKEKVHVTEPAQIENDLSSNELETMVSWMKSNRQPERQVRDLMKKTAPARLQELKEGDELGPVLLKYPRLMDTPGMIEQDYSMLYPDHANNLYEKWNAKSSRKVMDWAILQGSGWEKYLKLPETLTEEATILAALYVLPLVLPTGMRTNSAGKRFKSSKTDATRAFIDCQPVGTNLPQYLQRNGEEGTRKQPYILVLGDWLSPSQQFLVVEGIALPHGSTLAAIDACFKAFYVLNFEYPAACKAVWQFFQHGCYSVTRASSDVSALVRSLVTAFNAEDE